MKINFSLYNDQTSYDIRMILREKYGSNLSDKVINKLADELINKFYEIEFEVEVDETTGLIKDVKMG